MKRIDALIRYIESNGYIVLSYCNQYITMIGLGDKYSVTVKANMHDVMGAI